MRRCAGRARLFGLKACRTATELAAQTREGSAESACTAIQIGRLQDARVQGGWARLPPGGGLHALPNSPGLPTLQELAETRAKFEMGLGESRFYHGLAKQAQNLTAAGGWAVAKQAPDCGRWGGP